MALEKLSGSLGPELFNKSSQDKKLVVMSNILTILILMSLIIIINICQFQFSGNGLDAATGGSRDTCKRSEPCGWALYTPGSSPRKIYKYTRNILWVSKVMLSEEGKYNLMFSCSCSGGDVCSLTRDALQQNSFVFYCRPKETSRYRWPAHQLSLIALHYYGMTTEYF